MIKSLQQVLSQQERLKNLIAQLVEDCNKTGFNLKHPTYAQQAASDIHITIYNKDGEYIVCYDALADYPTNQEKFRDRLGYGYDYYRFNRNVKFYYDDEGLERAMGFTPSNMFDKPNHSLSEAITSHIALFANIMSFEAIQALIQKQALI